MKTHINFIMICLFLGLGLTTSNALAQTPVLTKIKSQEFVEMIYQNLQLSEPLQQVTMVPIATDKDTDTNLSSKREFHTIAFQHEQLGVFKVTVNAPKGFLDSNKKYPLVFITSGFQAGSRTALLFQNTNDVIIVGYEYPTNPSQIAKDPSMMLKTIRVVPGQIALALKFLTEQKWIEGRDITAVGISLGGLFLPVSLKLAEKVNTPVQSVVFAYTGTQLQSVIEYSMAPYLDENIRSMLGHLIQNLLTLHDPSVHAPELNGRFLVIQGTKDQVFPNESTESLYHLLNGQKDLVQIVGEHIDLGKEKLIYQTITIIEKWISRNK